MKYSKQNPKMPSPRQNTGAPQTSKVLGMWEMGCISWCLSTSYQPISCKAMPTQKLTCILTKTLIFVLLFIQSKKFPSWLYKREYNREKNYPAIDKFMFNNSVMLFSLWIPDYFCCDMTRLFSVSTHTRLSSLSTHANLTPIMIKRDKNMAHKHRLWRSICPVFSCWI